MNANKLINFFQEKIAEIDSLNGLDCDNIEFKKWHATTLSTCKRMGESYAARFEDITYVPVICTFGDDNSYSTGILSAKILLESFVEELETWGYSNGNDIVAMEKSSSANVQQPVMNFSISQNQTQSQSQPVSNPINLLAYNEETREKLKELAEEIHKPNNHSKVIPIVKWLADKSIDALVALLPSMIKFD